MIIIGTSALAFGLYDIYHKKWTGDLKIMSTALDTSALILFAIAYFTGINTIPAAILGATYLATSYAFLKELKNPNLSHGAEPKKCNSPQ